MHSITDIETASREAALRLAGRVRRTPLVYSPRFSAESGAEVWLKLENLQETGSFKLRGATNKLLTTPRTVRARGCVAASSGNHGAGLACAMQKIGVRGVVFVPEAAAPAKVEAIRSYGAEVRFVGHDSLETEHYARQYADDHGLTYVSPYNDAAVIAGQGSIGVEIAEELVDVDAVFVAVGSGGLMAGVGSVLAAGRETRMIACQPAASDVMARSFAAGHIVDVESGPTLSDGTAGGVEADSITFDLCRRVVDDFVLVDEDAIADAMRAFIDYEHQLIEGAAGVAVAAMRKAAEHFVGRRVVVLVCGGNVSRATLARLL